MAEACAAIAIILIVLVVLMRETDLGAWILEPINRLIPRPSNAPAVHASHLIGQTATVIGSWNSDPSTGAVRGQISLHGEIWTAELVDEPMEPGSRVSVVGVRGIVLVVSAVPRADPSDLLDP